jgi:filamentous hemagglutinin
MYRKTATVGSGSTADAIRYEVRTGELLSRSGHTIKGQEMQRALRNVIEEEDLDTGDAQIAVWLLRDLQNALSGL